ncbi:alpha/beta fold hydrolase [Bradyrhizobium sp. ma5]|uniref:alpha/beta fold hydrolase n=1 Tax=Bradyrhizobium sp. ma5 TaxID=3344828 RepID=UPI0035D5238F
MLRLGDSFELIAPDLRGCGDTGKPAPGPDPSATADRHALDMFALMDALGHISFGVIGGDLGAYVMQAMSHRQPRRLRGTLYLCTPYPGLGQRYGEPRPPDRGLVSILPAAAMGRATGRKLARVMPALLPPFPRPLVGRRSRRVRRPVRGLCRQLHEAGQHPGRLRLVSLVRAQSPALAGRQTADAAAHRNPLALSLGPP